MFWFLKIMFPGDQEFSLDRFYRLPCEYVTLAHKKALELRRRQLNENERPIALLTSITANLNRDKKRKQKPYGLEDFYIYPILDETKGPASRYGAAYLYLLDTKQLPSWALFCFKAVSATAGSSVPPIPALISENAILLAPSKTASGYSGMLIAREGAEGVNEFVDTFGNKERLLVPRIHTKFIASENVTLEFC